jgi:hypothetical protein
MDRVVRHVSRTPHRGVRQVRFYATTAAGGANKLTVTPRLQRPDPQQAVSGGTGGLRLASTVT